ncbi:MAG TPA: CBS domain-containing protein, partial [Thermococcus litoralis]|nr:CBS domain-containing protein [Thermococcus litoralis]
LQLPKKPVEDIMTTELKLATPHMSVYEVANIMTREHIEQLPVVKGEGEIIGLIRDIDLIRAIVKKA